MCTVESKVDIGGKTFRDLDENLTGSGVVDTAWSAEYSVKVLNRTHSMVFALLSLDSCHSLLMNNPMGTSTLPLKPEWVNSCVNVGAIFKCV